MKRINETGSQVILILAAVVVLGVAGFAGWKVFSQDKKAAPAATSSQTQNNSEASKNELAKTYKNIVDKFSVNYPEDWTETTTTDTSDTDYPAVDTELKSPSGSVLHLKIDGGGFGGVCNPYEGSPQESEATNDCPTLEYLYKDAIKATTYDGLKKDGTTKIPFYLVRTSIKAKDGKIVYRVGLETEQDYKITLNQPDRGFHVPFSYFSFTNKVGEYKNVVYAYAECDTPDNFGTSSDCGTAELILRSFNFYE